MVVKRASLAAVVTALTVVLVAAGCAEQTPGPGSPAPSSAPSDVASPTPPAVAPTPSDLDPLPTYRPSPRPKGSLTLPAGTAKPGSTLTLTGTVTAGVEGGCLLLDGYLLLNPNPRVVRDGARVMVTGDVREDMVTTCQQGTPFMIRTAEPA
jgi:hypothetical protein